MYSADTDILTRVQRPICAPQLHCSDPVPLVWRSVGLILWLCNIFLSKQHSYTVGNTCCHPSDQEEENEVQHLTCCQFSLICNSVSPDIIFLMYMAQGLCKRDDSGYASGVDTSAVNLDTQATALTAVPKRIGFIGIFISLFSHSRLYVE